MPALYDDLAPWWPLLSAPEEYAEEATLFRETLELAVPAPLQTLLELGAGGGHNASHLKRRFAMTLVDLAPGMVAQSRALNPECEHALGDMRSVRLGKTFDAVFVHDAVTYLLNEDDVRKACATAYAHVRVGGGVLMVPDWTRESFTPSTAHGGHDGEGRAMRYLEWRRDSDPRDTEVTVEYAFVLREGNGPGRVVHDVHRLGIFPRAFWIAALEEAGFRAEALPFRHSTFAPEERREMFLGVRRG